MLGKDKDLYKILIYYMLQSVITFISANTKDTSRDVLVLLWHPGISSETNWSDSIFKMWHNSSLKPFTANRRPLENMTTSRIYWGGGSSRDHNGGGNKNRWKEKSRDFLESVKTSKEYPILQVCHPAVLRSSLHQALGFVTRGNIHLLDGENAIQLYHSRVMRFY